MRRRKARDSDAAKKVSQFWLSVVTSGKPATLVVETTPVFGFMYGGIVFRSGLRSAFPTPETA